MLKLPSFSYFEDMRVTIYQDDTMFWKFYAIPDYISIRKDINGNRVFLLVKYAFGDQDREENPDLGRGGGYMAFDTEMSVEESSRPKLLQRLQEYVDDEWNRLKAFAESHNSTVRGARLSSVRMRDGHVNINTLGVHDIRLGLPTDVPEAPPGDAPPKVILSVPQWTQGTFQVSAPQSEALVSHRVTEGPLSLTGNNNAAVNMDLTEAGATFMQKTLAELDGSGATDLTPIQVLYALKFWARVPPVRLSVRADTRSLYMGMREIDHDYDGHNCSEDDMTHYDTSLQMAVDANMIKVSFDTGTLSLDNEFLQELRDSAMGIVRDLIKDRFFKKAEQADDSDGEDETDGFIDSEKNIHYLKTEAEMSFSTIEYDEEMSSIVEWPVNPQGTLQAFLAGLSPTEMRRYVREIDLSDPFFQTLGLTVNAFADWDNEPIAFVEVQVRYDGRDENNQLVEKQETFTLSKDQPSGQWDPSLIKAKREYSYRHRIAFRGREPEKWTRWEKDRTPTLNLSIAHAGKVFIQLQAGRIDFQQTVDHVQVEVSYEDAASGVQELVNVFKLADGQLEQTFERDIFTEWDKPARYRCKFFLKDGQMIETDWEETLSQRLLINAPLYDKLDVRMIPSGEWSDVVQSVVSLRYEDAANEYHVDEAFSIKEINEFKTWSVVLRNPSHRKFEYQITTAFKNGDLAKSDWIQADGDQALPVHVQATPHLRVKILANLLDLEITPVVECTLRYHDVAGDVHKVETFTFSENVTAEWDVAIADTERRTYSYELTYHTADGEIIKPDPVTLDATSIVLPKLKVPEVKATFVPNLLNFTDTPVVEVNVAYGDPANGIEFTDTLLFTDAKEQSFQVTVRDDSPTSYQVQIIYHLPDGGTVERPAEPTEKKRILIPRLIAA